MCRPIVFRTLVLFAATLILLLVGVSPAPAQESAPVPCEDFAFNHIEFDRIGGDIANISFEWTPVEGAVWYRLYLSDSAGRMYEYLVAALGHLVPVSDLDHPDSYTAWVVALDADQNELCRTAVHEFLMDRPYCPPGAGVSCHDACMSIVTPWCEAMCEGDPACVEVCLGELTWFCDLACGNCGSLCSEVCAGDPECEEECLAECDCLSCEMNCELTCLQQCDPDDEECLINCMEGCWEGCGEVCEG